MNRFETCPERKNSGSFKWDLCDRIFAGENLLPLWVADMDFTVEPAIVEAIKARAEHGIFGYSALQEQYYQAVIGWMQRRHNWSVERSWIAFTPGVVPALTYAIEACSEPGDEILVATPVYDPFYHAIENSGRVILRTPLCNQQGYYTFDFEDMERRITPKTKAFLLCSPHNPVGRVWSRQELEQLAQLCFRHDMIVIADEIHHDLVLPGNTHTTFARVHPEAADRSIICTAPSKTFNLAGVQVANTIIKNEELRNRFRKNVAKAHDFAANSFVEAATVAAYTRGESWLQGLLATLDANFDTFTRRINAIPGLFTRKAQGTYLAWVDAAGLGLDAPGQREFLVKTCGLAFNAGGAYGEDHALYFRVNLACPPATLAKALDRLETGCAERI